MSKNLVERRRRIESLLEIADRKLQSARGPRKESLLRIQETLNKNLSTMTCENCGESEKGCICND